MTLGGVLVSMDVQDVQNQLSMADAYLFSKLRILSLYVQVKKTNNIYLW